MLKRAAGDFAGRAQGAFQFRFSAKKGTWWQHGPMVARFQMSFVSVSRSFIGFGWFWSCPLLEDGWNSFRKVMFSTLFTWMIQPRSNPLPRRRRWSFGPPLVVGFEAGRPVLGSGSKGLGGVGHSKDGENYDQPVKIGV